MASATTLPSTQGLKSESILPVIHNSISLSRLSLHTGVVMTRTQFFQEPTPNTRLAAQPQRKCCWGHTFEKTKRFDKSTAE
jgi:hypothetical protein